ncbi:hypothetical protein T281_06860 [Rhodomicrobium udaipurense JA643]|nr:hypothetical protein T281_06860 [Rhodomicrobium udaipurense JA643]
MSCTNHASATVAVAPLVKVKKLVWVASSTAVRIHPDFQGAPCGIELIDPVIDAVTQSGELCTLGWWLPAFRTIADM